MPALSSDSYQCRGTSAVAQEQMGERILVAQNSAGREKLESEVKILHKLVDRGGTLQAICMLATLYLELGEHEEALHHAAIAVELGPNSIPARDILARTRAALGDFASALSDYETLAKLCREQRLILPDKSSIPAHFALHNAEQIDHIRTCGDFDEKTFANLSLGEVQNVRRQLADMIEGAGGEAPVVSLHGRTGRIITDPPYVRVAEDRLPGYLNNDVDYGQIQQAILTGRQRVHVIDDFLTPAALEQVRKFCLESTVWRHPYKFGYAGAFPQDGFASVSLFAIAEELLTALGEAFNGFYLAQWWAFVYNTNLPGVDIHADDADFALNLWIAPDSANLDPESGGLLVWDTTAPDDWGFDEYNSGGDRVREFLREQNSEPKVIPHRENRAVLFGDHRFHQTDEFTFAPGFTNRRRSLTFLFRRR